MDKNAIKKYAVWARRELISRVSQKALQYGITEENIVPADAATVNGVVLSNEEKKQRRALIEKINDKGYQQVMEEVAYTWFNRFIALRFMEVNGYLPSHVRVFTDNENNFKPQILTEAINLDFEGLNMDKVYELKDANDNEALFKYLLIVQCNALNPIMPRMFQKISDYTELLFPDNLLREGSVVQQLIELIPEEDWKDAVQIIGWLYQYYNSEKKDELFASLKKNVKITKDDIPAATQLFTPDWIVRYMVENSLGRLWIEGHPNEELKSAWKYYIDEAEQESVVKEQLREIHMKYESLTPEQIKCIDPCAGSGHILVYMFDLLVQIYEAYGYTSREAVTSIVKRNLYGLDIDERAAQLSYFSVIMKARQYDRRFLSRKDENGNPNVIQPNVYVINESNNVDRHTIEYFANGNIELKADIESVVNELKDAKEFGSILKITPVNFVALYSRFEEVNNDVHISRDFVLKELLPLVQIAEIMVQKYDIVITNPPYMTISAGSTKLYEYAKRYYQDSKTDLFAVFIEKCKEMLKPDGYQAMITMQSWLFLSSYVELRSKMVRNRISSLLQIGFNSFPELNSQIAHATSFIICNDSIPAYKGKYFNLNTGKTSDDKNLVFIKRLQEKDFYTSKGSDFLDIPNYNIAYWLSQNEKNILQNSKKMGECIDIRQGLATGNNDVFLRMWHEIEFDDINSDATSIDDFHASQKKYAPYNKGGNFRRWYGNIENVIRFDKANYNVLLTVGNHLPSREYYFRKGVTWSLIATNSFAARLSKGGFVFDVGGSSGFPNEEWNNYYLGLLCSKITYNYLQAFNPTINFQVGDIKNIPVVINQQKKPVIDKLVESIVDLEKTDWDSFETSWDFKKHPLVPMIEMISEQKNSQFSNTRLENYSKLSWHYKQWENACENRYCEIKSNEEELNSIFIEIYGLNKEISPEVLEKSITVRRADLQRDIKSLLSYAVGCMFGRYSLDREGLAFAGGEWDDSKYATFKADKDSIIPISDDEYFEDDIANRLVRFIEVVYGKQSLEDNLQFIADALGGLGQPREVIRKYFMNDFYADHLKMYQKRPIYWLFDSGKKNGFKALVYMHRYQPDTIARMRTDYVHEQQSRYRTAIADLEQRVASAATSERVKLNKKLKTLKDQAAEIQVYEEKIHHLADQYISIDLDDGVKVNYAKFQDVLAKIK